MSSDPPAARVLAHARASRCPLRTSRCPAQEAHRDTWRAWTLLSVRLGAVLLVTFVMWVLLRMLSVETRFPPSTMWATLGLFPVNALCLVLVRRTARADGSSLRAALGFERRRLGRDLLWGVLWLVVLNVPFVLVVAATVFALYGSAAPAAFETIFVDPSASAPLHPLALLMLALLAVVPFMLINAPTEELVFRGLALEGIAFRWGGAAATAVTSIAFGAQHVLFAASAPGMLVYFLAFTVWGACAAVIVRRQGRLMPVVIAHWIVNILMSAPALVMPVLQLTGAIPAP